MSIRARAEQYLAMRRSLGFKLRGEGRSLRARIRSRHFLARAIEFTQAADVLRDVIDRAPDTGQVVPSALAERLVFEQGAGVERNRRERDVDVVRDGAR